MEKLRMDGSHKDARSRTTRSSQLPPFRFRTPVAKKRALLLPVLLFCMLFGELLGNWTSLIPTVYAAPASQLSSTPGHLTAQQYLKEGQQSTKNQSKFKRPNDHSKAYKV